MYRGVARRRPEQARSMAAAALPTKRGQTRHMQPRAPRSRVQVRGVNAYMNIQLCRGSPIGSKGRVF